MYARLVLTGDTYDEIHLETGDIPTGQRRRFAKCLLFLFSLRFVGSKMGLGSVLGRVSPIDIKHECACVCVCICVSVCLSAGHIHELC